MLDGGIIACEDLASAREGWRDRRLALATGCFDLLHVGHLGFLMEARAQGDLLLVAINSDRAVRALKGEGRPIVGERDRSRMIAALRCVNAVFILDDIVADAWIEKLRPDVFVLGEESVEQYPSEVAAARAVAARVHVVRRVGAYSTTAMLAGAPGNMSRA